MKLNLGCGSQVPEGWVNVDYALGARLMKVPIFKKLNKRLRIFNLDWNDKIYLHDLTRPFPWEGSIADVVYTSHTLEHLSKNDGRNFLKECHRVLRANGILRIVVPDLQHAVRQYFDGEVSADDFVQNLGVLYGGSGSGLKYRLAPLFQFPHKCMYDTSRLLEILSEIGFESSPRDPFDSDIDDIRSVELLGRTDNAAIVEGRKQ